MTHCILSTATASSLYRHASAIRDELLTLGTYSPNVDRGTEQALDEAMIERDVHSQALEAFMAERVELQATICHLTAVKDDQARALSTLMTGAAQRPAAIGVLGEENAKLRKDVEALESATIRAAQFITLLRTRLAQMGVTFEANELGEPDITLDALELANFMYAHVNQASAG